MLHFCTFLLATGSAGATRAVLGSARVSAFKAGRTASAERPLRAALSMADSAVSADYSLDNMVLNGPLQPLKDQVLVKLEVSKKQTSGGLFLTGESSDKPTRGTVVSAGPGKPHPHTDVMITNPLTAGDSVLFGQFAGTKVKYCLDDHVMLSADEVLAKIMPNGAVVPIRDRAMLKPIEKPVQTSAGIVLTKEASKAQEVPNQGEVVALGEGRFTASGAIDPIPLKIGDKVMYTKYGGVEVEHEGQKLVFVFAADCLAKYA
jgi:co-chaperonin GroES (HSP10)